MSDYNVTVSLGGVAPTTGVYLVTAYGADPTGVADSTAFIQAAIDAAEAAGGGEVLFPTGTYKITATLVNNLPNVTIRGPRSAVLKSTTNQSILAIENGAYNTVVSGLSFATSATTGFTAGRGAVVINSGATGTVHEVTIEGIYTTGLRTGGIAGRNCENVVVRGCHVVNTGEHGIYLAELSVGSIVIGNTVSGVNATTNNHTGVKITGKSATMTGNRISGMDDATGSSSGITVEGVGALSDDISFSVTGNQIKSCQQGVRLSNTKNVTITGNTLVDNTLTGSNGDITIGTNPGDNPSGAVDNVIVTGNVFHGLAAANNPPTNYNRVVRHFGTDALTGFVFDNNVIAGSYAQITDGNGIYVVATRTAADDDATPSVLGTKVLLIGANTNPTTLTALDDAIPGQTVMLVWTSATNPSAIADAGNFNLSAAITPTIDDALTLFTVDGSTWREVARSQN